MVNLTFEIFFAMEKSISVVLVSGTEEKLGAKKFWRVWGSVKIRQSFFANLQGYHVNTIAHCVIRQTFCLPKF